MTRKPIQITNRVKAYCDRNQIDRNTYLSKCLAAPHTTETGKTLSADTFNRIYDGETSIGLQTAGIVAKALGVELSELFDIR